MSQKGDITLSVDLQAEDIQATAAQLRDMIEQVFSESYGKNVSQAFQSLQTGMSRAYDQSVALTNEMTRLEELSFPTEAYTKLNDNIKDVNDKIAAQEKLLKDVNDRLDALRGKEIATEPYQKLSIAFEQLQERADYYNNVVAQSAQEEQYYTDKIKTLQAQIKQLIVSYNNGGLTTEEFAAHIKSLRGELTQAYRDLQSAKSMTNEASADLADVTKNLQETEKAMQKLVSANKAFTLGEDSDQFKQLSQKVKNTEEELDKFIATRDKYQKQKTDLMDSGKAFVGALEMDEYIQYYDRLNTQLNNVNNQMSVMLRKQSEMSKYVPEIGGWQTLINVINTGPIAIKGFADSLVATLPPAVQVVYAAFTKLISVFWNEFKSTITSIANTIKNVFVRALNAATAAVKSLIKALLQLTANSVLNPLRKLGDAIADLGHKSRNSGVSLKQLSRMFLQYGIGVRSLYRLINKLRTALFEGFADLALVYDPFNNAMSQITTALNYLKNSFAAAFAPIVEFIAPAISIFTTKVAEAVQMIGQLIAALTGKEFVMALPVWKDYAESTKEGAAAAREQASAEKHAKKMAEDEAKAEKKRAKALKDVRNIISGFDDIKILMKPTDDTEIKDINPEDYDLSTPTLEMALKTFKVGGPITKGIQAFADMLKKAWETANAYNLGVLLSKQLGNVFRAFNDNIDKIRDGANRITSLVATFAAGFLSVQDTFKVAGVAVRNAVNTIFEALNNGLIKFRELDGWSNLGKDIYMFIMNALKDIDWKAIKNTFFEIGAGIATALNEVLTKPSLWSIIFTTINEMLYTMCSRIIGFAGKLRWGDIGTALAEGINTGIDTFPIETMANAVYTLLAGLWDLFYNTVTNISWDKIGSTAATLIIRLFETFDPDEFATGVLAFIDGLYDAFIAFVETPGWDKVVDKIGKALANIAENFDWEGKIDAFVKFLNNAIDALENILDQLHLPELFNKLYTHLSTSSDFQELCGKIIDLAIKFTMLKIKLKFASIGLLGAQFIKWLGRGAEDAASYQAEYLTDAEIRDLGIAHEKRSKDAEKIGAGTAQAIGQGYDSMRQSIVDSANNVVSEVEQTLSDEDKHTLIGETNMDGYNRGISGFRSTISGSIREITDDELAAIKDANFNGAAQSNMFDYNSGISENGYYAITSASEVSQNVYDALNSPSWSDIGSNIINGISDGISNGWSWLYNTIWDLANDLYKAACDALDIRSPSGIFRDKVGEMIPAGIGVGINKNQDTALEPIDTLADNLVKSASNIKLPPIAMGEIIPYKTLADNTGTQDTITRLSEMLSSLESRTITKDDLESVMIEVFRRYMNIDFYIGEEKLTRIVNRGNALLDIRYHPVKL